MERTDVSMEEGEVEEAERNQGTCEALQKRRRHSCIFNCSERDSDLNSPKDLNSWTQLVRAAEMRCFDAILDIAIAAGDGCVPEIFYHRQCRNRFTKKRDLDSIIISEDPREPEQSQAGSSKVFYRRQTTVTSSISRVYEAVCIFCLKTSKYMKSTNKRDPLIKCVNLQADKTIRDAATHKNDTRVIALLSRDLVAAEGHYHRQCYRDYTRPPKSGDRNNTRTSLSIFTTPENIDSELLYARAEKLCYDKLFDNIRDVLFKKPRVIKLTELTEDLTSFLREMGITEIKSSTKKHIQRKLQKEFGQNIHMIPNDSGKILVYPDNLLRGDLVKENMRLREELDILTNDSVDKDGIISKASRFIRNDVRKIDISTPWPVAAAEMSDPCIFIPDALNNFLRILFVGSPVSDDIPRKTQILIQSVGQDIVYGVTCARVKPPKHIILPQAVKSLTGNTELIQILNRYGHGISYTTMEEFDTALALKKLESHNDNEFALPNDIYPNTMVTLAWDNIDRLEETLSGGGTSHRVNGILIQPRIYGPHYLPTADKTTSSLESFKRTRTLSVIQPCLPLYNAGERVGPLSRAYIDVKDDEMNYDVYKKTLLWVLARLHSSVNQCVGSWTGFNINVRENEQVTANTVRYLPTINAPAPELSTMHEILLQSQKIRRALSLQSIVLVFDQALYAKATEVIWKHKDTFSDIVPRLGVFHTVCTLLGVIGKRFQDAGLKDLCIESGVIAEGSIGGVLDGHKYNRAVRFHKLLYEALLRLAWRSFCKKQDFEDSCGDIVSLIEDFSSNVCSEMLSETLCNPLFVSVAYQFFEYLETLRFQSGELAAFWMSYIDLVNIVLNMLRASREGNWCLHLQSVRDMIPWCFAYDRMNYARYLTHYYTEMTHLKKEHPELHNFLDHGGFSVQLSSKNPFGRIPIDQAIEETVNKDTQTAGGTKGFSLKASAITRYYLTAEYRSSFLHLLRDTLGTNACTAVIHPDLSESRMRRDERDITSLVNMLENNWVNPFCSPNQELLNISTGIAAPGDISHDLLTAKELGENSYIQFREERLESQPPKTKFHDPIKKANLKTFTDMRVKRTYQSAGRAIIIKADRDLFAKMILIAQTREVDLKEVLAHRVGPIPWALATPEGTLRKTVKSSLYKHLTKESTPVETIPDNSACIIDGMALVQKLDANHMTFTDVADTVLNMVLREGPKCSRIDVVFDVYREQSIKDLERANRGSSTGTAYKTISPGHKITQWRKFLCAPDNKNKLIEFLVNEWSKPSRIERLDNKCMFVTTGRLCKKLSQGSVESVSCLASYQEEADTRLLLHAAHCAAAKFPSIIIISEDTDVFVLCVAFSSKLSCPLYLKSGTKTRTKFTDIQKISKMLGEDICQALPGLHAFTGCDTVSAFAGKGKIAAYKLLAKNKTHVQTLKMLGSDWSISDELMEKLEAFTCNIYNSKTTISSLNDLRFNLFCARKGEAESWQLPPCSSSLVNHCRRANYQCAIWKRSLEVSPEVPDPIGHGWGLEDDFHVFDDCGQPGIVFKHITDILEPSLTIQIDECPNIPPNNQPSFFGILTLGNASVTNTILEVSKMSPIPVINPSINLDSFKRYQNFIGLSSVTDFEVQAILHLLHKLEWTYSGIIYSNTEFSREIKDRLMSDALNHGICFAFNVNTSDIARVELEIENTNKRTKDKQLGIVYIGDGSDMGVILKKNNPKIHWFIFDSFGGHFKTFQAMPNLLKGALTLYPVNVEVDDFETLYAEKTNSLASSQKTSEPIDDWINNILYRTNQKLENIPPVDVLRDDASGVMDAVYVLAKAKKEVCNEDPASCQKSNLPYFHKKTVVDYSIMANFSPTEFREQNRSITILNNIVKIETSSRTVFNILNFWDGGFKKVGTFSRDYQLSVSLDEIKMTNEKGNEVRGNNLPKSLCSHVCMECQQPDFKGILSYIPGDILLLGMFSIHDSGPSFECGKFRKDSMDAIASEAFLYTIKQWPRISPNITLGGILIDDCYNSIQASMNISLILSGEKKISDPSTGEVINPKKIVAVIGPLASGVTKSVADLLTHEKMLMISYAASSHDLDDRISYPYFLRTVPSDTQQVNAIVSLLNQLNWRYVGIIYANNNYGAKAKEIFIASAQKNHICVSLPKAIEESSVKAKPSELENTLDDLMKDQVKIVVYFGTNSRVNDLVLALKRKGLENMFVFIGSETWGITSIDDLQTVAGSLTLTLDGSKTADTGQFMEYLTKRTLKSKTVDNPFFNMFWYNFHKCNPPNGFRNKYNKACTGNERFSNADAKKFARDQRSVHTMNALYAVFEGIKKFQNSECKYITDEIPCDGYTTHVNEFVSIMKTIKLKGYDDLFEVFDEDGNGRNTFKVHNIQRKESQYVYESVGEYNVEYNPVLRIAKLRFYDRRLQERSYVNVTCVSPYTCCDRVKPTASPSLSQNSIRVVDIVILTLLCVLFVFFIVLVSCFLLRCKQKRKKRKPSPESSEFQDESVISNGPGSNRIPPKRPPTVYIRSDEPLDDEAYQGVVTYQIIKTQQDGIHQLSPISQSNATPNHVNTRNTFNNSGFEPDNMFLFPDTASQSASTSYEEIASPQILEQANVFRRPTEALKKPQTEHTSCYSNGDTGKSNLTKERGFRI